MTAYEPHALFHMRQAEAVLTDAAIAAVGGDPFACIFAAQRHVRAAIKAFGDMQGHRAAPPSLTFWLGAAGEVSPSRTAMPMPPGNGDEVW